MRIGFGRSGQAPSLRRLRGRLVLRVGRDEARDLLRGPERAAAVDRLDDHHCVPGLPLRRELPEDVYLWVNAYKDQAEYYQGTEVEWLTAVDPAVPVIEPVHPGGTERRPDPGTSAPAPENNAIEDREQEEVWAK